MDVLLIFAGLAVAASGAVLKYRRSRQRPEWPEGPIERPIERYAGDLYARETVQERARGLAPGGSEARFGVVNYNAKQPRDKDEPEAGQDGLVNTCAIDSSGNRACYWVSEGPTKAEAALRLRESHILLSRIHLYCKRQGIFSGLCKRFPAIELKEANPKQGSGVSAFTMQKWLVVLCLKAQGSLLPTSSLFYPLIHELGHCATNEMSHTPQFWANFRALLALARSQGFYVAPDELHFNYCGSVPVHYRFPNLHRPESREYREFLADLKADPEGQAPLALWTSGERDGNALIASIVRNIPTAQ
jgi:hypothetical protein